MKTIYSLDIDTGRQDLHSDPAANFFGGVYYLSTIIPGWLDSSSLGSISQENMILFGGEFSLINNVNIEILSPEIINHSSSNGINLIDAKCSLKATTKNVEIEVFKNMRVISYSQESFASFKLTLADAAFADAFVIAATIPMKYGGGDLPLIVGGNQFLKVKKIKEINATYNQGHSNLALEYGRTFAVRHVSNDKERIAIEVECYGIFAGDTLEVIAGKGKGKIYEVLSSKKESGVWKVTLDAPYESDVLQGSGEYVANSNVNTPHFQGVTALPILFMLYTNANQVTRLPLNNAHIFLNPSDAEDKITLGELSICRVITPKRLYAVAPADKAVPSAINVFDDFGNVKIITLPDADNGRVIYPQCRYVGGELAGTSIHNPKAVLERQDVHVINGSSVSRDFQKVFTMKTLYDRWSSYSGFAVGAQICVQWELDRDFSSEWLIPAFGLKAEGTRFYIGARALLLTDDGVTLASKEFFATRLPNTGTENLEYSFVPGLISMTGDNSNGGWEGMDEAYRVSYIKKRENLAKQLRTALKFDTILPRTKFVCLQVAFLPQSASNDTLYDVNFRDEGIIVGDAEAELEYRNLPLNSSGANPIDATMALCYFCKINYNRKSFMVASDDMRSKDGIWTYNCHSYYEIGKSDSLPEKIAEACRAANFSVMSDGSNLEAKFLASESGKTIVFTNRNVIKESFDIEYANQASCVTNWNFTMNIDGSQKFLSVNPLVEIFPEASKWERKLVSLPLSCLLFQLRPPSPERNYMGGGMVHVEISETATESERIAFFKIAPDLIYALTYINNVYICKVCSCQRISENKINVIFEQMLVANGANLWEIPQNELEQSRVVYLYLAASDYTWKSAVMNNLNASWAMANALWNSVKNAFELTHANRSPDERYQNMKFAAFDSESQWLQCLLWKVKHCEYQKSIVSFSVPLEVVESGSLWQMLLCKAELQFGMFQNAPLKGWIVGVELSAKNDEVKIKFISSEPLKDKKYYNENESLPEKKIVETNTVQNTIKE